MSLLVFIPMYDCAAQIPRVLAQFNDAGIATWVDGILCIDNRSTDGTVAAAKAGLEAADVPSRVLLQNDGNYGLGGSHKVAIEYAAAHGYTHLAVLHGDDQGSIRDLIPHLEARAHERSEFLMGARFMRGSTLEGYSTLRTAANRTFNLIFSAVSGTRLYDLGSGLNVFRVSAFSDGFHLRFADDLTFNYYLILAVAARGHALQFFPLTWREDDQVSNAKLGRMGLQILGLLWRRVSNKHAFLTGEHRDTPRTAYPSTRIARWDA
ncbi:Glycosyl transferase family 2 [Roseivivax jejudonensis]|uniref:Glycosyl transferase family 2 n=1 Tax=Roseivivax jejudonensis TaxID=1529041 RepID=A0A1X6Y581_9RHOB|nr:glycosyltransferase family 2 protein [Roseivivax jejudonensis]SLN11070.1 Glycosyl transferase family 2 [Roseivivax jejudonensis]